VNRLRIVVLSLVLLLDARVRAHAGPCSERIAQVEREIAAMRANPTPGGAGQPSAPQTLGAQLHRQPTPGSVEGAMNQANAAGAAALERARKADAAGDAGACAKALDEAKLLYGVD